MKLIVVTSPVSDSGKTVLATGLSEAAAVLGHKTLLIDLDNHPGEMHMLFGCARNAGFPTVSTWTHDCWPSCARSPNGGYFLPAAEISDRDEKYDLYSLLDAAEFYFDLVILDMGIQGEHQFWKQILERAHIAALVTDCDSKAMSRLNEFMNASQLQSCCAWTLVINNREGKRSYYSASQVARMLSKHKSIKKIIEMPFYPQMERRHPATFEPTADFAVRLLNELWGNEQSEAKSQLLPVPSHENKTGIDAMPEQAEIQLRPDKNASKEKIAALGRLFASRVLSRGNQGVIINGRFTRECFVSPIHILDKYDSQGLDAVVVPASMGFEAIKEYRRDPRSKSVLLIVIKGDHQHIALGADRVAVRVNSELVQSAGFYAARLRELWSRVELDYLTACYKREFFEAWLHQQEQQERRFSIVFIDPDRFKSINDSYGHDAGDSVLIQFSSFLRTNSRCYDLVFRWGGDEFVVAMPDTSARQAYVLIDRLREKWASRMVHLPGGENINCTFSAGVAEYYPGCDVVKLADKMMYQAKQNGRNQVHADFALNIAILGLIPEEPFRRTGYNVTESIVDADYTVCDVERIYEIPADQPVYVLGNGDIGDWTIKRSREQSRIFTNIEDIINAIGQQADLVKSRPGRLDLYEEAVRNIEPANASTPVKSNSLAVLPGARSSNCNQTVPINGALFVVCPSRPGMAGETAASLALAVSRSALVCASPEATAAVELHIPEEVLITSDWRLPGAKAPLDWSGIKVWPVDPHKFLDSASYDSVYSLVEQIKSWFALVVVDCGGSLSFCSRVARNEGILVLRKEGDSADLATSQWLKKYGSSNIMVMAPSERAVIFEAENGFVISSSTPSIRSSKYY